MPTMKEALIKVAEFAVRTKVSKKEFLKKCDEAYEEMEWFMNGLNI